MQAQRTPSTSHLSLLIISDSDDHLSELRRTLSGSRVEITGVYSMPEVVEACNNRHDLAVVDVGPADLSAVLRRLRTSAGHVEATVLVPLDRSLTEPELAGVLTKYRAMPCTSVEMQKLVHRRAEASAKHTQRGLL